MYLGSTLAQKIVMTKKFSFSSAQGPKEFYAI